MLTDEFAESADMFSVISMPKKHAVAIKIYSYIIKYNHILSNT